MIFSWRRPNLSFLVDVMLLVANDTAAAAVATDAGNLPDLLKKLSKCNMIVETEYYSL